MSNISIIKKLCRLPKVTEEAIESAFGRVEMKVEVSKVNDPIQGFEIKFGIELYFLSERPVSYLNKVLGRFTSTQQRLLDYGVPAPLHIGEGALCSEVHNCLMSANPQDSIDNWLYDVVDINSVSAYFLNYFSKSKALNDYRLIILEAIESFYIGFDHTAIMSLIPVFEGGLRNVQNLLLDADNGNVATDVFEKRLKQLVKYWGVRRVQQYDWHPGVYGNEDVEVDFYTHVSPQADVINAFRLFFKDVLYKKTGVEIPGFNRHVITHMLSSDFNRPSNFLRMFLALTHITFIESLCNTDVPFFWKGHDDQSRALAKYLESISCAFDGRRNWLTKFGINGYEVFASDSGKDPVN